MVKEFMGCPLCDFASVLVHRITEHLFEEHLDLLDTDYNKETGAWSYWTWLAQKEG